MSNRSELLQLFNALNEDLKKDETGPNVHHLLEKYINSGNTEYKEYTHFNDHKYCRNLIAANDILELMVICWKPNQASTIHNHAGQRCWAAVVEGTIQETHFHFASTHQPNGEGPLEVADVQVHKKGEVSFITDDIALHQLTPLNDKHGVTLHIYSKPIPQCNVYCREDGKITQRKLGYYSINKVIQQETTSTCAPFTNG